MYLLIINQSFSFDFFFFFFSQALGERVKPLVVDTVFYLHNAFKQGKNVLIEGANAALLDIDFGKTDVEKNKIK